MGAWGAAPWDTDAAWDFVDVLTAAPVGERAAVVAAALESVVEARSTGQVPDVDAASAAVAAASLVAMARSPMHFPDERERVVDYAARVGEVGSFADLVGDLRALRTAATARTARAAVHAVENASELTVLWGEDPRFGAVLDAIRRALQARTMSWPTASRAGNPTTRPRPIRTVFGSGAVVMMDLGDATQGYAVMRDHLFITCLSVAQPVDQRPLSPAQVAALPVAFTTTVNIYCEVPSGWTHAGTVPDPEVLGPLPAQFWQALGRPHHCGLFGPGAYDMVPATQQECVGLDRYGPGLFPAALQDRLRCHLAGVPHPETEDLRVQLSHSVFRVVAREQATEAAAQGRFPAGADRDTHHAYYDLDHVPRADASGAKPEDLVLAELDEAAVDRVNVEHRPLDPDDPGSPTLLWARRVPPSAVLAVHDLTLDPDGRLAPPTHLRPRHPR